MGKNKLLRRTLKQSTSKIKMRMQKDLPIRVTHSDLDKRLQRWE